jgi:hypothetical protein
MSLSLMSLHVNDSRMLIRLREAVEVASWVGYGGVIFEMDAQDSVGGVLVPGLPKQGVDAFG